MKGIRTVARAITPRKLRNCLRSPGKTAHYVLDRAAFVLGARSMVQVTEHWSVKCHPAARAHFEVFRTDPSQADELAAFFAYAHSGMRLLDVGSHFGFFALAALHAGGTYSEVVSIEPSAGAAKVLCANLDANGLSSRVRLIQAALGSEDGELPMLSTGPAGADYLVVPTERRVDAVMVKVRSMSSVLDETRFRPTHIKIDVEGYEFEVIESAADILAELRPVLYLELHGDFLRARDKDPAAVIASLRTAGYGSFICEGQVADENVLGVKNFNCRVVCLP